MCVCVCVCVLQIDVSHTRSVGHQSSLLLQTAAGSSASSDTLSQGEAHSPSSARGIGKLLQQLSSGSGPRKQQHQVRSNIVHHCTPGVTAANFPSPLLCHGRQMQLSPPPPTPPPTPPPMASINCCRCLRPKIHKSAFCVSTRPLCRHSSRCVSVPPVSSRGRPPVPHGNGPALCH